MSGNVKKPLVILTGPTAVGKTEISIKLAKAINGEIISADSIQVYKHFDIGSAKVTKEEMDGVKHYLIDVLEPDEEFNIYVFKKLAKEAMEEIYAKGKIPIIAGGTGFYIQALLYDIEFAEEEGDKTYRHMLEEKAKKEGVTSIHNMLKEIDPEAAKEIHENNLKRVIRALEYYNETGMRISEHNKEQRQKESPYNFKYYVLNMDREKLYNRINLRVDIMVENGLIAEVTKLKEMGYGKELNSMQGIGYKEIRDYVDGVYDLDTAIETMKKNTRNFAKRQITWFKREKEVIWLNHEEFHNDKDKILDYILDDLHKTIM
ncbi:MAG: tRNA (adenosine(37)-N6)-dimethylallyltransferase MiaA [Lachnospiraceae bacterium]|nr:tRNA (adenosine(37)-N6)-dimethylallyltransferase MiaA [Lachnospiraceae bacterium]